MTRFAFQGTGQTTGGGSWKIAVGGVLLLLSGGGSAAAAVTGIAAAVTDLLYWVAGTLYGTAALAGVALVATRSLRAERRARDVAMIEARRQAREDEIEQRHARRAITAAHAQAQAWAPVMAGLAAAMNQPQPQPVPVVRGEVER